MSKIDVSTAPEDGSPRPAPTTLSDDELDRAYARSSTYTTVVIAAGYAGAFAVWGNTQSKLTSAANIAVGLSLITSLLFFAGWEVFAMIVRARKVLKALPSFAIRVWVGAVIITVTCALIAFGLLAFNYLSVLTGWWGPWPGLAAPSVGAGVGTGD